MNPALALLESSPHNGARGAPGPVRLATIGELRSKFDARETLASGLPALDALTGGFPRGAISEITGPESSGRGTLANALLAAATAKLEICAYIDAGDAFDPVAAAGAGVALPQLLWVRCGHDANRALKAADFLLHAGGFGVVLLDLCRVPTRVTRNIPLSYWYRFRRAVENTPTIFTLLETESTAKSCTSLLLDLQRKNARWSGAPGFQMLRETEIGIAARRPMRTHGAQIRACAGY